MATRYVDKDAVGAANGTSWADAWTSVFNIAGLSAGDIVEISGGATGQTKTYPMPEYWNPAGGTSGNRITYRIGQDAAHNGTAIFNHTAGATIFLSDASNIIISGDAGDGAYHFKPTGYTHVCTNLPNSVTLEYLDLTDGFEFIVGMGGDDVTGFVLDHFDATIDDLSASTAIAIGTTTEAYGNVVISNGILRLPHVAATGFGTDGLSIIKSFDCINVEFIGYEAAYVGGQHQDGWQATGGGKFIRIYNCTFTDMCNYSLYGEAIHGGYQDVYIYNNVARITDPNITGANGFVFGPQGSYDGTLPCTFLRVVMANNTFADYLTQASIALNNVAAPPVACVWTDCVIKNNAWVNSGTTELTGNASTIPANNSSVSSASAALYFVLYTINGANNDFRLTEDAMTLIGTGQDLSAFFTTDAEGTARTVPWDLGPYVIGSTPPPVTGTGILTSSGLLLQSEVPRNLLQNT